MKCRRKIKSVDVAKPPLPLPSLETPPDTLSQVALPAAIVDAPVSSVSPVSPTSPRELATSVRLPPPVLLLHVLPDVEIGRALGCSQTQWERLCQMLREQDRAFEADTGDFVLHQAYAKRLPDALLLARYNALRQEHVPAHYVTLAALYRLAGRPDAVIENIVKAVRRGLTGAMAYGLAASLLRHADHPREACDMFERALARPEADMAMWGTPYAVTLSTLGRYADAAKVFLQSETLEPLPAAMCLALGRAQLNIDDAAGAIVSYRWCLTRLGDPDSDKLGPGLYDPQPGKERGTAHAGLALAYAKQQNISATRQAVKEALKAGISAYDAAFNLAAAGQLLGDANILRLVAATARICRPDCPQTHVLLGRALWEVDALPEAVRAWEHALQLGGVDYESLMLLGHASALLGATDRAADAFGRACTMQPQSVPALVLWGQALASVQQHAQAASALSRAAQIEPTSAAIWIDLADAHVANRAPKKACEALHKACKLAPDNTVLHLRLADALVQTAGAKHLVRRALTSAAALAPGHVETRVRLGILLTDLRQFDEAATHLRAALDASADYVPAWRALVALMVAQLRHQNRHAPLAPAVVTALDGATAWLEQEQPEVLVLQAQTLRLTEAGARVSLDAMAYLLNADLMREMARPKDAAPARLTRVQTMCDGIPVAGDMLGHSYDGRPIVQKDDGTQVWGDWNYTIERRALSTPSVWQTLAPASRVYQPLGHLRARLDAALATRVAGDVSVGDFVRALHSHGHVCMLAGGQVRDALAGVQTDPDAHADASPDAASDIDIVTCALPTLVHQLATSMFGQAHISSPWHTVYHGVVRVADKLDIATLRSAGMYEPRRRVAGARGQVFPLVFAPHLAHDAWSRDFCCNANFYDPQSNQLIDVTGHGVEDAMAKRLRLASDTYVLKNRKLALRYCKYRARGYTRDAATRVAMRDNAVASFTDLAQTQALLKCMLPAGDAAEQAWEPWLDMMRREAWGDVIKTNLQPAFAQLEAKRAASKAPGAS